MSFLALPNFRQPLTAKGENDRAWYTFLQGLWKGTPPSAETALTVGVSPFTYTADSKGFVIIQGGTVSLVQWSRGGITNRTIGATQGCFPVSQGDSLIVTYTGVPAMVFVPQ